MHKDIYTALQPAPKDFWSNYKTQLRIHILGAAYAISDKTMICSPFVQRTVKMPKMFSKLGHIVYHYGHKDSQVDCTEHITVTDDSVLEACYGNWDRREQPPVRADDAAYQHFQKEAERELRERVQPDDIVLSLFGWGDKTLIERLKDLPCHFIEASIGYPDSFYTHRVFQSPSKMHFERGRASMSVCLRAEYPDIEKILQEHSPKKDISTLRTWEWLTENQSDPFGTVIPPMSDPDDFEYSENKSDYMLFIGRVDRCKGLDTAIKLSEWTGDRLLIAGPLRKDKKTGDPLPLKDIASVSIPDTVEYVGIADVNMRKELYRDARVLIAPSRFLEPGHNTLWECNISGTPYIACNHGIAMDYTIQGINGFVCQPDDFSDVVSAYEKIDKIKHAHCREFGMNFALDNISLYYHEFFHKTIKNAHRDVWEAPDVETDLDFISFKPMFPFDYTYIEQKILAIQDKIEQEITKENKNE